MRFSSSFLFYESLAFGAGIQEHSMNIRCIESTGSVSCCCFVIPLWTQQRTLILVIKRMDFYSVFKWYQYALILWVYITIVAQQSQILYFITTNTWEYKSTVICNLTLTHRTRANDFERGKIIPLSTMIHSY